MWQRLHDVVYERRPLVAMQWSEGLLLREGAAFITACPYGGVMAVAKDPRFGPAADHDSLKLCTAAGKLLRVVSWRGVAFVAHLVWLPGELLLSISRAGVLTCLSAVGEIVSMAVLDRQVINSHGGISLAVVNGAAGMAILCCGDQRLLCITGGFERPDLTEMADADLTCPPLALQIIIRNSEPQALVATEQGSLLLVTKTHCSLLPVTGGPFSALPLSFSGRTVAAVSQTGKLQIYPTAGDFEIPLATATVRSSASKEVRQLCWLGEDCLAFYSDSPQCVYVGGPRDLWLSFPVDSPVVLVPECDGVRVIGPEQSWHIGRVPVAAVKCQVDKLSLSNGNVEGDVANWPYGVPVADPASLLIKAEAQFSHSSPEVNETAEILLPRLPEAIETCIAAAESCGLTPPLAVRLLQAASFGKKLLADFAMESRQHRKGASLASTLAALHKPVTKQLAAAIRDLRVLNALRGPPADLPLSIAQFRHLGPGLLLRVLARRRLHLLALRIGEWCGLRKRYWPQPGLQLLPAMPAEMITESSPSIERASLPSVGEIGHCVLEGRWAPPAADPVEFVLSHWLKNLLRRKRNDDEQSVVAEIQKLFAQHGTPEDPIDAALFCSEQLRRSDLAQKLLELDPRGQVQVNGLLRLGCEAAAVRAAAMLGDGDLALVALLALLHNRGVGDLLAQLEAHPALWGILTSWCLASGQLTVLQRLTERCGALHTAGWLQLVEALRTTGEKRRICLAHAAGFLGSCSESADRGVVSAKQLCLAAVELHETQTKLVESSEKWTTKFPPSLVGAPLAETIKQLFRCEQKKQIQTIAQTHGVSAQRLGKWELAIMCEQERWDDITRTSMHKNTPAPVAEYGARLLQRSSQSGNAEKVMENLRSRTDSRLWRLLPTRNRTTRALGAAASGFVESLATALSRRT